MRPLLLPFLVACQRGEADTVFTNGLVLTMDEADTRAEALAVQDGRIVFIGTAKEAKRWSRGAEVVDLGGLPLMPGFVDAHTHLVWSGTALLDADLYAATTLEQMLEIISSTAEKRPDEPWVRGTGWDASIFEGQLSAAVLDAAVPDRPAYMESADAHSAWVNSAALAEAGIDASTPDPEDGEIERDEDGAPTGILRESAMELVTELMPDWSEEQVDDGLRDALDEANGYGLTTLVDANCEDWMLEGYARAEAAGTLSARVRCAWYADPEQGAEQLDAANDMRARFDGERLKLNAAKLYLDGVLESQTAVLLEPYADGSNGAPSFEDEALLDLITAFDADGYQLHMHVIGDGAVRQALDAIEALEQAAGNADRRPLLAHIELIDEADVARFAALGAYGDMQALWAYPDPYITELTIPVIGEERAAWLYPFGALDAAGATLVAGSDWSVSTMNPWEAIEVALTRKDPWTDGGEALNAAQAIDLETALLAYTRLGARAAFLEEEVGSLEIGKRADLVWLDRDPFSIDETALSDVAVKGTWIDGERVR